ncbi:MAG: hypothetical protein WB992_21450 [Bryobacteraceae bacterium]
MSSQEAIAFLQSMDVSHVVGLRNRGIIAARIYASRVCRRR